VQQIASPQADINSQRAWGRTPEPKRETIMNPIRHIRRIAAVLAGLAAALVAFDGTPAFATLPPPEPAAYVRPPVPAAQVHAIVVGGMPGWQITLIAIGAALLAAVVAVLADRIRAAHREAITTVA
jgi:hypothetical protein